MCLVQAQLSSSSAQPFGTASVLLNHDMPFVSVVWSVFLVLRFAHVAIELRRRAPHDLCLPFPSLPMRLD